MKFNRLDEAIYAKIGWDDAIHINPNVATVDKMAKRYKVIRCGIDIHNDLYVWDGGLPYTHGDFEDQYSKILLLRFYYVARKPIAYFVKHRYIEQPAGMAENAMLENIVLMGYDYSENDLKKLLTPGNLISVKKILPDAEWVIAQDRLINLKEEAN